MAGNILNVRMEGGWLAKAFKRLLAKRGESPPEPRTMVRVDLTEEPNQPPLPRLLAEPIDTLLASEMATESTDRERLRVWRERMHNERPSFGMVFVWTLASVTLISSLAFIWASPHIPDVLSTGDAFLLGFLALIATCCLFLGRHHWRALQAFQRNGNSWTDRAFDEGAAIDRLCKELRENTLGLKRVCWQAYQPNPETETGAGTRRDAKRFLRLLDAYATAIRTRGTLRGYEAAGRAELIESLRHQLIAEWRRLEADAAKDVVEEHAPSFSEDTLQCRENKDRRESS